MRRFLFLIASARTGGNTEILAREAAKHLPADARQTWLRLSEHPLEPFTDIRHSIGVYPHPTGHAKTLCEATLEATDIVMVSPLYWYSVSTSLKRYLDEWSAWMRVPDLQFKARMQEKTMWVIGNSAGDPSEAQPMFATLKYSAEYLHMRWGGHVLGHGSKPGDVLQDQAALEAARALFASGS